METEGGLHQVNTEVDWDRELGTVTLRVFGNNNEPALSRSRVAMMFGLPKTVNFFGMMA